MEIRAEKIAKHFKKNGLPVTSLRIKSGECLCITGESGCGKSTLLNILSGMMSPDEGDVYIDGRNLYKDMKEKERTLLRRSGIGYMMQGNTLIPELSVWQNIVCPVELSGLKVDEDKLYSLTDRLHISGILDSYPSMISGGEYRRVLLARVMMLDTKILLVDEPTSNLDEKSAMIVRKVLRQTYSKYKKGLVIVTHDNKFLDQNTRVINIESDQTYSDGERTAKVGEDKWSKIV